MAISLANIQTGVSLAPPRILVYGVQGIGKTTMLSQAPNPILIQTEDGEGLIDVPRFPLAKSYDDVMSALALLATEDHKYNTVGIDSLDWFETMVWEKVIQDNPIANKSGRTVTGIESYDFQKGYKMALDYWREYVDALNYLRNERGMMVMQLAHSAIQTFDSPDTGAYDRYTIKLHANKKGEGANAILQQHSDCVFFINYKVGLTQEKSGFNQTKARAIGSGQRSIFTQERPAYSAKNRYNLPESINFDKEGHYWSVLAAHIPFLQTFGIEADNDAPIEVAQSEAPQPTTKGE